MTCISLCCCAGLGKKSEQQLCSDLYVLNLADPQQQTTQGFLQSHMRPSSSCADAKGRHLQLVLLEVSEASVGLGDGQHPCPAGALQLHLLPQLPPEAGELRVIAAPARGALLSGLQALSLELHSKEPA